MQSVPKIVRERLKAAQPAVDHPDADLLTAFAEQALPLAERATVLDHLARCGDCRDIVALALPATETLETVVTPVRGGWLTWPALRWGFVAAGVVVIAGLGFLQYQRRSTTQMMAYKSPAVAVPESRAQAPAPAPAAPAAQPAENHDNRDEALATPTSAYTASGAPGAATESKRIAPGAPSSAASRGNALHSGMFVSPVAHGPKPPSQFQFNNNAQQQVSNAAPLPTVNMPGDQRSSAKHMPTTTETVEVNGAAPVVDSEAASLQAPAREQSADSQLSADANSPAVAKAKLPVPLAAPGQIGGYVVDPTGAVVSNARVTITPTIGGPATAVTNDQGAWLIAGLPTGNYKAQAQAPGFRTSVLDLNYDANQPSTFRFTLSPGSISETVEVSAETAQVQTEGAHVGGAIANRDAVQAPINGRNFTALISRSTDTLPRWTISSTGALQRSFDQGNSWQSVDVNANPASFASLEAVAKTSRAKEKDADKKAVKRDAAAPTFRAVAAAGSEVWAGGSGGALYHSLDAGNRWTRVVPTSTGSILTGDIIRLEFSDPQHGKITTSTPEVWTTSDAGQTWQKQ